MFKKHFNVPLIFCRSSFCLSFERRGANILAMAYRQKIVFLSFPAEKKYQLRAFFIPSLLSAAAEFCFPWLFKIRSEIHSKIRVRLKLAEIKMNWLKWGGKDSASGSSGSASHPARPNPNQGQIRPSDFSKLTQRVAPAVQSSIADAAITVTTRVNLTVRLG